MKQKQEPSRRKALKDLFLLSVGAGSGLSACANVISKSAVEQKYQPAETGTSAAHTSTALSNIRLAVSTYSYWHFDPVKYPIEKVIEHAQTWASMG